MDNLATPKIALLATGGTIAGKGSDEGDCTGYTAGAIGIGELLAAEGDLSSLAEIHGEQLAGIDSKDITERLWLKLAGRINELFAGDDIQGIVVTHGTDTLEETAYFLSLTVKSNKPVVLTGAMRPATALSADGPMNLRQAIKLAAAAEAKGRGVMAVLNDTIFSAKSVTKAHTTALNAFAAPNMGRDGYFTDKGPVFYRPAEHYRKPYFDVKGRRELPYVKIIYGHAADDALFVETACARGVRGIVYAGMGNGSIPAPAEKALEQAISDGVAVVRSTRVYAGAVQGDGIYGDKFIVSGNLPPAKARILLSLALTTTDSIGQIRRIFAGA